jgi:hypothetical protein
MKEAKTLYLTANADPDLFGLINQYAAILGVLPTTATKRFLRRSLPAAIRAEKESPLNHISTCDAQPVVG